MDDYLMRRLSPPRDLNSDRESIDQQWTAGDALLQRWLDNPAKPQLEIADFSQPDSSVAQFESLARGDG